MNKSHPLSLSSTALSTASSTGYQSPSVAHQQSWFPVLTVLLSTALVLLYLFVVATTSHAQVPPVDPQVSPQGSQMAWYGTGHGVKVNLPDQLCNNAVVTVRLDSCKPLSEWITAVSLGGFNNSLLSLQLRTSEPPNGSRIDLGSIYYTSHPEGCVTDREWSRPAVHPVPAAPPANWWLWLTGSGSKYIDNLRIYCGGGGDDDELVYSNGFELPVANPAHSCYRTFGFGPLGMPDIPGGCIIGHPVHGGYSRPTTVQFPPITPPPPPGPPVPFSCTDQTYMVQGESAALVEVVVGGESVTTTPVNNLGSEYNAAAFHPDNRLVYAMQLTSNGMSTAVRIGDGGGIEDIGVPVGLPTNVRYDAGEIVQSPSGVWTWIVGAANKPLYAVDLSATPLVVVGASTITGSTGYVFDWAVGDDGRLYGGDSRDGQLAVMSLTWVPFTATRADMGASLPAGSGYGGAWWSGGRLYLYRNAGAVYELNDNDTTMQVAQVLTAPSSSRNDAAYCP